MQFDQLEIQGLYRIAPEMNVDARGFFARVFCEEVFRDCGLVFRFSQSSVSFNSYRGTVRGMHFSVAPHAETKLVRCTAGAIHDVVVDLRPASATYLQSVSVMLSAANRHALYIPVGLAHGFQTLCDATEVLYSIDKPYVSPSARGLRWNDPAIHVTWPEAIKIISERDLSFPDWVLPQQTELQ